MPPAEVLIPRPLQKLAQDWLLSGTLQLSATTSARHARALQRALILSLLLQAGYDALPDGLQGRAAWLFRRGWASGLAASDGDDLCFVLGLTPGADSRQLLTRAAQIRIPADVLASRSSPPKARPSVAPRVGKPPVR